MTNEKKKVFEEKKRRESDRLAEQIEETQRRREQKAFLEDLGRRISIARRGRLHFEENELVDAMNNYRRFMSITARSMNCEIKDLHPRLFDEKNRVSESLLISAICLDLTKILDQMNSADAKTERATYFRLFIAFTNGMPFQFFVSESFRKYLQYSKVIRHRTEFQTTYDMIKKNRGCFVATVAFGRDDAPEVSRLRRFRDEKLLPYFWGRGISALYYFLGPTMARAVSRSPRLRAALQRRLSELALRLP